MAQQSQAAQLSDVAGMTRPSLRWFDFDHGDTAPSCRVCTRRKVQCDGELPRCRTCSKGGLKCAGYGVRIRWPEALAIDNRDTAKPTPTTSIVRTQRGRGDRLSNIMYTRQLSSLGLPESESYLMQHYLKNLARVAIAIDYDENGYRSLMHAGLNDPCLLNSMLAVSSSHHSKWRKSNDSESRQYLRKAFRSLQERLKDQSLVYEETMLVAMLSLLSYEIFNGSTRWLPHYHGILGWLAARGDCSDLNPFIKTWISMVDTQRALNLGGCVTPEVERWLESGALWMDDTDAIDPFFGCSVRLPKLMAVAAKLYDHSRRPAEEQELSPADLQLQARHLEAQVRDAEILISSTPSLAISCHGTKISLHAIKDLNEREHFRRIVAAAELFRHATLLYIFRITHSPHDPLPDYLQASVRQMYDLLTIIPDAIGPGSNLGWCLTVLGAESDLFEDRDYIRGRLWGIQTLGLDNSKSAGKVLERVWVDRDSCRETGATLPSWQDTMRSMGEGQILV
ncbi:hypothetical protein LTR96_011007 [Exophiala xenobiotica]|nr:hypothetical protein H2202_010856 [Exophiala xenobiotica]KAK5189004.1 hypothetical protein LTR92_011021 [Exophiala xenobiotica]KAK5216008.1 hypothetical protein LTR72_010982 [Exophiala xenobiotica]KAK5263576.1 hypothetical protein LTR96_011007 [Exophiala xenobiotica]KAK5285325.1 hypothetical protein LTR14_011018 [Exophiala xenobiotica]